MADGLIGTWNYESVVNMDEYMDTLGVPAELKEMAKNSKPVVSISKDGNKWTIKTTVGDKVSEGTYPENEEIEIVSLMGAPVKATLKVDGSDLVETQKVKDMVIEVRRKIDGDKLLSQMTVKGVQATVTFTKA